MAKVYKVGDQIVIALSISEADLVSVALLEGGDSGLWIDIQNTLGNITPSAVKPQAGPDGKFACQVDPLCSARCTKLARASRHCTARTLQLKDAGHLPKLIRA